MKHLNYGLAMTVDPELPYGLMKDGLAIDYYNMAELLDNVLSYWLDSYETRDWHYSEPEKLLLPGELL